MIKANYLLLSEWITLDQITWLASVYNVLEKFQSPKFPFTVEKICMLSFFERKEKDPSKYDIEYKLFNNDTLIKNDTVSVDFNEKIKHKRITIFQGVEMNAPGELRLSIYHDWKEINRYVIELEKV